jgi:hypothetical protein
MAKEEAGEAMRDDRSACYGDVVGGVRRLGQEAIDSFLDGLAPHVVDIASDDADAQRRLGRFLHDWGVTVAVLEVVGGPDALREAESRAAAATDVRTGSELIAALDALSK